MPRRRQSGAQRPYRYRHVWYTTENGERVRHERMRWRVRIDLGVGPDGKRIRRSFTADTSRECMDKLRKAREEYAKTGTLKSTRTPTLAHYVDLYMDHALHHLAPNTYISYKACLKYLGDILGMRVDAITPLTIDNVLERTRRTGVGYSTVNQTRTVIRQSLALAVRDRTIAANPADSTSSQKRRLKKERRAFTIPEIRAFLEATMPLGEAGAAIWWWRFFTGMRQGELLGACVEDLHLDADMPFYVVNWSMTEIPYDHGCGRTPDGGWECGYRRGSYCPKRVLRAPSDMELRRVTDHMWLKRPKNGRPRWIPLSPELVEVTRRYLNAVKDRPNPHGLLFRNEDGSPRTAHQDNAEFDMLLEKAGMDPKQRTGHETRYSAVTLMRRAGVDRKAEREIIGHVDDRVDDLYMTLDAEQKMEAVESIGRQLRLEPPVE